MSTFQDVTLKVINHLTGYTRSQEQTTYLTSGVNPSDTSISVADASQFASAGRIEIDNELIWIGSVDNATNTITIPPFGRGYDGTTAEAHTTGTKVTINPFFPQKQVKDEINNVILGLTGILWAVKRTEVTFNPVVTTYSLPSDVYDVLAVSWQTIGPSQQWRPVRRWFLDNNADTTTWATGRTLDVHDAIVPGRTMNVTYMTSTAPLVNDTDDFTTVSGLASTAEDVVVYGACARLAAFIDAARMNTTAVEAGTIDSVVQVGTAANLSKYFMQLFQMRVQQEQQRLLDANPPTIHYIA